MKKTIVALSLGIISLVFAGSVFAQNAVNTEKKAKNIAYCRDIEVNLAKRTDKYAAAKAAKFEQYERLQTKLASLITRLENEGYDVSQLQIDKVNLEQKILIFEADYDLYLKELVATKTFTCGKSEDEFRAKLLLARAQLATLRADATDIRTFWTNTIKPHILAVKIVAVIGEGR